MGRKAKALESASGLGNHVQIIFHIVINNKNTSSLHRLVGNVLPITGELLLGPVALAIDRPPEACLGLGSGNGVNTL